MTSNWILETHGDPIGAVRKFVHAVWENEKLEKMLVPTNGGSSLNFQPFVLDNPKQLKDINPFRPLMTSNAARFVPELVNQKPVRRIGTMLRPCEMRALSEMAKRDSFSKDNLLTICVDCLGTYPVEEYNWRVDRKGTPERLEQETLQFARQGGVVPYRYRSACQMCTSPNATDADINIGVIGLHVREYVLVSVKDEKAAERLQTDKFTDCKADEAVVQQRDKLVAKLVERNGRVRERIRQGLTDILPSDVSELANQLSQCDRCQKCLEICPICSVHFPKRGSDGIYIKEDMVNWLISCSGCGMCEQACPRRLPLSAIFTYIRHQLAGPYGYINENTSIH